MRIGLNLLHALPEIGGGWNYIQNLVVALGEYDRTNSYVAFVTHASECLVPTQPNFEHVLVKLHSESRPRRIVYENTVLQYLARKRHLDCMHWFASTQGIVNTVPAVVTVHDLQPFLNYAGFSLFKRVYLRLMMSITMRRASILLPVSQATARDLERRLNADPGRMVVIPAVVGDLFKPATVEDIASFRARYCLPEHFWLYVAHLYPHKNHVRLLRAYYQLKQAGHQPWPLVLRGDPYGAEIQVRQHIARWHLEEDVIWLPRLVQRELVALYSAASALIFPSLYEGGGIPVLEAMACGCPVVASDIPPVREFAGDAASYFDPTNVDSIAQTMLAFQNGTIDRERGRQRGLSRVAEFRAESVVVRLLAAYSSTIT
jgi:glycosyltransferase involved in cell wall biosynthesis